MSSNPASHAADDAQGARGLRPRVAGKFIFVGEEKFYVRGVTYGTFAPDAEGWQYGTPEAVARDFASMREAGFNAVRTYTRPPLWLLDLAAEHGLRVMVGLAWEQHIAFLDDGARALEIEQRIVESVRACARHPSVLCYTIGNEIPAPIVRWHGRRKIEQFLARLYAAAKREDPEALVTYVNYPSTEYLELPFADFYCFNVYLESEETLAGYLARLQNLAEERPVVLAEIGLDSRRHGLARQAEMVAAQVRVAFASGCAGAFVFAWTDEWWRGGFSIEDWDFGLVTRGREPKPALASVARAFAEVPFPPETSWPSISVVVCSYNGARTIRDCLEGLLRLEYPRTEVIVVDDGSTDETAQIAAEYPFRLIRTPNRGLSAARNAGMLAATGDIVAYTDDDARPDPHWLQYLAHAFLTTGHAGVGGPNIAPAGDGLIAECVASAPGSPVHVLLTDREAEHIPGCNMSFRREWLLRVGGCDARFRTAGDDVDLCWRVQAAGGTLGFSPAALVWHHRRNSVSDYWRQQKGYGKAEALLEEKWPEKYNAAGHLTWAGRLYGRGLTAAVLDAGRARVGHGTWGANLFQSIYQPAPDALASLPLMPEWFLFIGWLAALSLCGLSWRPLLSVALPLLLTAVGVVVAQACLSASRAQARGAWRIDGRRFERWLLTAALHLIQPLARLLGRLRFGLTLWRSRGTHAGSRGTQVEGRMLWRNLNPTRWSEHWRSPESRLLALEGKLREAGAGVRRGGEFDAWDLETWGGVLGRARLLMAVEEHGGGKQLARFRIRPKPSTAGLLILVALSLLALAAALDGAAFAAVGLGIMAALLALRLYRECSTALGALLGALANASETWEVSETGQTQVAEGQSVEQTARGQNVEQTAAATVAPGDDHQEGEASTISSIGATLFRQTHLPAETDLTLKPLHRHTRLPEPD